MAWIPHFIAKPRFKEPTVQGLITLMAVEGKGSELDVRVNNRTLFQL